MRNATKILEIAEWLEKEAARQKRFDEMSDFARNGS